MSLTKYLKEFGMRVETDQLPHITVHNIYPPESLKDTNYADELIERERAEIKGLIGSDVLCWNQHVIPGVGPIELKTGFAIGRYSHLYEAYERNCEGNFLRDFWHQDMLVDGLISLHHPPQEYPRISHTLFIGSEDFKRGFFEALRGLCLEKREELETCLNKEASWRYADILIKADKDDRSFFDHLLISHIIYELQKALPFFTDILDPHLEQYAFREKWHVMNRTLTINNDDCWHKRDCSKQAPHQRAGVLLRRQYNEY